jgi:predicted RNA-binding protein with PUA-like domain
LERCITLEELKGLKDSAPALAEMALLNRGRLSVQPVSIEAWEFILGLE